MTLQQNVGYQNLPHDGRFYRLDYVGAVHRHSDPSLNLSNLSVHFTPVIPDFPRSNKIFNSPSVDKSQQKPNRPFQFNVGDLLRLKAGSVWKDGVCIWEPIQDDAEIIGLDLAKTPVTYKQLKELNLDTHFIPHFGTDMNMWVACIEHKGDPEGIIVPAMELIRFYFANSSKFTHAIFNRGAHDLNTLVNVKECHYFDSVKLARVMLRKDYRDDDGPVIARMFRDANALKAARHVWDSIYEVHTKHHNYTFFYPEAYFPFVGTTKLSCFGKSVKSVDSNGVERWHKFVHTILGCTAPFGFDILSLTRENDNSKGAVDNPDVKERNVPHKARANIQDGAQIDTDQRPDANIERELIRMEAGRFAALDAVELIKEEKYQQKTKNLKKTSLVPKNDPYTSLSTGLESYAQDANAAGLDYTSTNGMQRKQPTPRKAAIDASLRNTVTMLNGLISQHCAVVTSLFPGSNVVIDDIKLGEFPLKTSSEPARRLHWSKYKDGARRLVAVKVDIDGNVRYLFDFERRGQHEKFAIYLCSTDLDDDQVAASLDGLLEDISEVRAVGLKDVFEDCGLQVKSVPHSSTSNLGFIDRAFKAFIG
jgi:hypothetical protein